MKTPRVVLLLLVACSPDVGRFSTDQLTGLTYPNAAAVYIRNQAIAPNVPTLQGSGASFSASPELPAGLQIDGATGKISGTPVTVTGAASYAITARNASGAAITTINIRIADSPPQLVYDSASYTFALGESASTGVPANSGAQPAQCTQSDLLALGLLVDPNTCEISGAPRKAVGLTTYVLSMQYNDGVSVQTAQASVSLIINGVLAVTPPTITLSAISEEQQTFTGVGGRPPYSFSVSGLGSIDSASGVFTSSNDAGTAVVTVSDLGGTVTTANITSLRSWVNGPVKALAGSSNNWVFVGGIFDRAAYIAVPSLIAANASTGLVDYAFDLQQGFDGPVTSLVASADSVYVGGNFRTYRGLPARGIAKIFLANGQLDTDFTHGNGAFGTVNALALSGNTLYLAGNFSAFRGGFDTSAVSVNATNGNLITNFIANANDPQNYSAVALGSDAVYFGGLSQTLAAFSLDGTYNGGFAPTLPSGGVTQTNALTVANNTLYVGGNYGTTSNLYAVSSDGTSVTALAAITGGPVTALATDATALYVGGQFTSPAGGFVKLSLSSGTPTSDAINGTGFSPAYAGPAVPELVSSLAVSGNTLYVGGAFLRFNGGQIARGFAALDTTSGQPLPGFGAGAGCERGDITAMTSNPYGAVPTVAALAIAGNDILVGGSLGSYRGLNTANIAKFETDSNAFDSTFKNNARAADATNSPTGGEVDALLYWNDTLFVGGKFTRIVPFSPGSTVATGPFAALSPKDGTLITDGFTAPTLSQGAATATLSVNALEGNGSSVFIGGSFDQGTNNDKYLTTINDATGVIASATTFAELDAPVTSLVRPLNSNQVDVAGPFTTYQTCTSSACAAAQTVNGYLRVDNTKTAIAGYSMTNTSTPTASLLMAYEAELPSGYLSLPASFIFIGGSFTELSNVGPPFPAFYPRADLAQFAPASFLTPASALPYAPTEPAFAGGSVRTMFSQPTNILAPLAYVGGDFAFVDGLSRPGLARLTLPPPGTPATAFFVDESYDAGLDGGVYNLDKFGV